MKPVPGIKLPGVPGGSKTFAAAALLAVLAAAALRAAYSLLPPPSGDGGVYLHAAAKIAAGEYFFSGGVKTFGLLYRTPGYPLFLAALDRLSGGSAAFLGLAQHLLGLFSALLAYSAGRRLWGRAAGLLAFLFAGLHFHFIYLEAYPLSEALAVLLLLASVRLLLLADDAGGGPAVHGLAGLAAGAGALCRAELAGLVPVYAAWILFGRGGGGSGRRAAAFLLPPLLLLGAWTLRNGLLFDYWGLTPNSAVAFFDGPAGACSRPACGDGDAVCAQAFAHQYDDGRVNRGVAALEKFGVGYQWAAGRIGAIAAAGAAAAPACYAGRSLGQLRDSLFTGSTWPPRDLTENMPPLAGPGVDGGFLEKLGRLDGFLEGWLLVPLFLGGCIAAFARRRRGEMLPAACALLLLAAYAFLSPLVLRYRVPAEGLMGLLAAGFPVVAWRAWRGARREDPPGPEAAPAWLNGRLAAAVLAAAFLALLVFLGGLFRAAVLLPRRAAAECAALGGKAAEICAGYERLGRGKYPAALKRFDAALALDPADKAAGDGRASALFRMGRAPEALEELRRGLRLHGPAPDTLYNMAVISHLSGSQGAAGGLDALLERKDLPPAIRAAAAEMRLAGPP